MASKQATAVPVAPVVIGVAVPQACASCHCRSRRVGYLKVGALVFAVCDVCVARAIERVDAAIARRRHRGVR